MKKDNVILLGLAGSAAGLAMWLATPPANAQPADSTQHNEQAVGCQDDLWITWHSTRRSLCDGAIRPDGSWLRNREFYTPAHMVPLTTNCYGTYFISCTTTGGYFQPRTSQGVEDYIVYPDNVLPDEPGHLLGNHDN